MDEPKWKANKRRYNAEYKKNNDINVGLHLNKVTDADLIETLNSIPNKSEWFKDCLRKAQRKAKRDAKNNRTDES